MAKHSGKNGVVKMDDAVLGGLANWDIEESVGEADLSSADEAFGDFDPLKTSWSGSITLRLDHAAGANQTLRAGDIVAIECYSEGDAAGKTYYSGDVMIASHGVSSPYDGAAGRTYAIRGKGALSIATVSA